MLRLSRPDSVYVGTLSEPVKEDVGGGNDISGLFEAR